MKFDIKSIPSFDKSVKAILKKHPSFKTDLLFLKKLLLENPKSGISLGNSCYKIRVSISSKNKGKSAGARVITHVVSVDELNGIIYLIALYDKAEHESITDNHIKELLKQIE